MSGVLLSDNDVVAKSVFLWAGNAAIAQLAARARNVLKTLNCAVAVRAKPLAVVEPLAAARRQARIAVQLTMPEGFPVSQSTKSSLLVKTGTHFLRHRLRECIYPTQDNGPKASRPEAPD